MPQLQPVRRYPHNVRSRAEPLLKPLSVTAAALNVTEPSCTGIGGDIFCLFYDASSKTVRAVNGSGKSPQALSLEYLRSIGIKGREIPLTNMNAVTVPGAASGWIKTIEEFGSGKLTMKEILEPAIRMAEEGKNPRLILALTQRSLFRCPHP